MHELDLMEVRLSSSLAHGGIVMTDSRSHIQCLALEPGSDSESGLSKHSTAKNEADEAGGRNGAAQTQTAHMSVGQTMF